MLEKPAQERQTAKKDNFSGWQSELIIILIRRVLPWFPLAFPSMTFWVIMSFFLIFLHFLSKCVPYSRLQFSSFGNSTHVQLGFLSIMVTCGHMQSGVTQPLLAQKLKRSRSEVMSQLHKAPTQQEGKPKMSNYSAASSSYPLEQQYAALYDIPARPHARLLADQLPGRCLNVWQLRQCEQLKVGRIRHGQLATCHTHNWPIKLVKRVLLRENRGCCNQVQCE